MNGLYRFDMEVFRTVNVGWHSDLLTPFFWAFSYTGLGFMQVLFCLVFFTKASTRRFLIPCLTTIAFTGLAFAQGIKRVVPRERPSNMVYTIAQEGFKSDSFVSGHTTTSFALATMIALLTKGTRYRWVGPVAFLWAIGVGVSRIYRGVHWPTDVLGGACAGVLGSSLIYLLFTAKGWIASEEEIPEAA